MSVISSILVLCFFRCGLTLRGVENYASTGAKTDTRDPQVIIIDHEETSIYAGLGGDGTGENEPEAQPQYERHSTYDIKDIDGVDGMVENIWRTIFEDLKVDPKEHPVFMSEPPGLPAEHSQRMKAGLKAAYPTVKVGIMKHDDIYCCWFGAKWGLVIRKDAISSCSCSNPENPDEKPPCQISTDSEFADGLKSDTATDLATGLASTVGSEMTNCQGINSVGAKDMSQYWSNIFAVGVTEELQTELDEQLEDAFFGYYENSDSSVSHQDVTTQRVDGDYDAGATVLYLGMRELTTAVGDIMDNPNIDFS